MLRSAGRRGRKRILLTTASDYLTREPRIFLIPRRKVANLARFSVRDCNRACLQARVKVAEWVRSKKVYATREREPFDERKPRARHRQARSSPKFKAWRGGGHVHEQLSRFGFIASGVYYARGCSMCSLAGAENTVRNKYPTQARPVSLMMSARRGRPEVSILRELIL